MYIKQSGLDIYNIYTLYFEVGQSFEKWNQGSRGFHKGCWDIISTASSVWVHSTHE